jgi:hypothetical protein
MVDENLLPQLGYTSAEKDCRHAPALAGEGAD